MLSRFWVDYIIGGLRCQFSLARAAGERPEGWPSVSLWGLPGRPRDFYAHPPALFQANFPSENLRFCGADEIPGRPRGFLVRGWSQGGGRTARGFCLGGEVLLLLFFQEKKGFPGHRRTARGGSCRAGRGIGFSRLSKKSCIEGKSKEKSHPRLDGPEIRMLYYICSNLNYF